MSNHSPLGKRAGTGSLWYSASTTRRGLCVAGVTGVWECGRGRFHRDPSCRWPSTGASSRQEPPERPAALQGWFGRNSAVGVPPSASFGARPLAAESSGLTERVCCCQTAGMHRGARHRSTRIRLGRRTSPAHFYRSRTCVCVRRDSPGEFRSRQLLPLAMSPDGANEPMASPGIGRHIAGEKSSFRSVSAVEKKWQRCSWQGS